MAHVYEIGAGWNYKHNKLSGRQFATREEAEMALTHGASSLELVEVDSEHDQQWLVYESEEAAAADRDGSRCIATISRISERQIARRRA